MSSRRYFRADKYRCLHSFLSSFFLFVIFRTVLGRELENLLEVGFVYSDPLMGEAEIQSHPFFVSSNLCSLSCELEPPNDSDLYSTMTC